MKRSIEMGGVPSVRAELGIQIDRARSLAHTFSGEVHAEGGGVALVRAEQMLLNIFELGQHNPDFLKAIAFILETLADQTADPRTKSAIAERYRNPSGFDPTGQIVPSVRNLVDELSRTPNDSRSFE